ncbi:glutaredoxin family protein [Priestia endophytica]
MKLVKFEKDACPNCMRVGAFLNGNGIEHEVINADKNPKEAIKHKLGFAAPVTILFNDEGEEIQRSNGFNIGELEEMVEKLKS